MEKLLSCLKTETSLFKQKGLNKEVFFIVLKKPDFSGNVKS